MIDLNDVEILLVEDEPHDAEFTLRALKKHGIDKKVHAVKDGAEALDFVFARGSYRQRKADCLPKAVLLDLRTPKVDGLEFLRRVRADELTKALPVVIFSSSTNDQDIEKSYALGATSYIVKPVDFEKFIEAVAKMFFYCLPVDKPLPRK